MILDVYYNPEETIAISNAALFMLAGFPLLFATAGTIDKYRATQKKEKKIKDYVDCIWNNVAYLYWRICI